MPERLIRTSYLDPTVNPPEPRQGDTGLHESRQDQEGYFEPLHRLHGATLHGWGVASGLQVAATLGQPGLRVLPGAALDGKGRLISLAAGGHAKLPDEELVPVTETGVRLPTTGVTGERYVTIGWGEAFDYTGVGSGVFNTETTPVFRLRDLASYAYDGEQIIIAQVTFDQGKVIALREGRQATGISLERIDLLRPAVTRSGAESVLGHETAAALRAARDGGLVLDAQKLVVHHQGGVTPMLWLDAASRRMGVGTAEPAADLDVRGVSVFREGVGIATTTPEATLDVNGTTVVRNGAIMPSAGNSESAGILFPRDPGGGAADRAYIRYFPVSGENTKLVIGNDNDPEDAIAFRQGDVDLMLMVRGNVGIGTDNPVAKLEVRQWESDSTAVIGQSYDSFGVMAISDHGPALYASGYPAARFNGDVHITGRLVGGYGVSTIDHPLDPAGRYLSHSAVESDEMKNVYDGEAVLDENGTAEITLPDWFEALNGRFRYQLTPIGGPAPNLHVARKLSGNSFTVAGGEPGSEICWLVTGLRQDPHALANPLVVESDKAGEEHGRYRHPEAYGADSSLGIMAAGPRPAFGTAQE
ncbi:hypothetical protein [Acrocarpospora catenulata]|uniref:hypothetical protein n=1 Tax=Acrocarpospora catenulata TaxID=2836182 RepID=UPI001BD9B144|nr:hypothetical protein [Acrocarpospora catenulata]